MAEQNHHLFTLGTSIEGVPVAVDSARLTDLGALEVRDLERWVKATPQLLGEDLLVLSSQLSESEHVPYRLDVLALDRTGQLVVIELKRDDAVRSVELQALRYAARVSTMTADDVAQAHANWRTHDGVATTVEEARQRMTDWVTAADETGSLVALDDDRVRPRIILVAGSYPQDITATVLFLRSFEVDISCVQLSPYRVGGDVVLLSQVLIPLPEAKDYEARRTAKRQVSQHRTTAKKITPGQAQVIREFLAAIPDGRWTSYGEVAFAITGQRGGGRGIGSHLRSQGADYPHGYRVMNRHGEVSPGWVAALPELPQTPDEVQQRLEQDGVTFVDGRASDAQLFTVDEWKPEKTGGPEQELADDLG